MTAAARPKPLTDLQLRVLDLVQHRAMTEQAIWARTTVGRLQVRAALNVLVARGLVTHEDGRYFRRST